VTSARPSGPIVSLTVTAPAKVRRIIRLIDQLPIVQPGVGYSCPSVSPGQPIVTFDFRAAVSKPILAQARVTDYGVALGPYNPVSFSIRGHRKTPLVSDNLLTQAQRLLSIHFRSPARARQGRGRVRTGILPWPASCAAAPSRSARDAPQQARALRAPGRSERR
jgi:hypothetical protein